MLYVIAMVYFAQNIAAEKVISFVAVALLLTIALIIVCYMTGEKPKWQWGKE